MTMPSTTSYILSNKWSLLRISSIVIAAMIGLSPRCADAADADTRMMRQPAQTESDQLILQSLKSLLGEFQKTDDEKRARRLQIHIKGLGFESVGQLDDPALKVGEPLPIYVVRLDELKTYRSGKTPRSLLLQTNGKIFPILIRDKTVSSATVVQNPNESKEERIRQWGTTEHILLARARDELRDELPKKSFAADTRKFIAVLVPAMGRYFLGITNETSPVTLELKALVDGPGHLRKGDHFPAEQIFEKLSMEANTGKYDITPREFPSGEPIP